MSHKQGRLNPLTLFGEQKNLKLVSEKTSYVIQETVGYGTFGIVVMAKNSSGEVVAMKRVVQDHHYKNRELPIMEMLHHVNVLELKDSFFSKIPNVKDDYILNIVMDYMPYNLFQVTTEKVLSEKHVVSFSFQLARSLTYIHSLGICHRDIKPQNVLVNLNDFSLKLCDFGSAKQLDPKGPNISYICSRYYRAPELIFDCTHYSTAIDIWAYGCVVAEMVMQKPLFKGYSNTDQLTEIMKILGNPSMEQIYAMNRNTSVFRMPQINAIGVKAILAPYKYPPGLDNLLEEVLQYNPFSRPTGMMVMAHPFHKAARVGVVFTDDEVKEAKVRGINLSI
ncbi:hypothetical protein EIN_403580 [Entamoeba invadens IP1]|uniref:Protein kinase domain-containing protein n=1 Tax=Entamoeba invadens IP1 TaxID=370355 RepID=A0A0A1UCK7_ENTIV|nr:hypothetical protein EIN_403580 [Entamoeba invadens IP1]ELP90024.1 hypothetical protein EIN_403580 [Entamoeba invadens IP1]|eukprot:XP_004256795.1 hypothetical protein EIN_403580 [Entamoeba invadens IP1]